MSAPHNPHTRPTKYHALVVNEAQHPKEVRELLCFRKRLFVDHCGWMLPTDGDIERDQFDTPDAEHCMLYREGVLIGGFRAIRCDRNYLSQEKFPQLATERSFPNSPDHWEISRFGVLTCARAFEAGRLNYAFMFRFAQARNAAALIAIADLTYERFLKRMSIHTVRYGAAQIVGFDRCGAPLTAVAGEIPLHPNDNPSISKFIELSRELEITDAENVLGRATVSARSSSIPA